MQIHLWSSPRNISTALMYAFAQREDLTVVDEPLYAHYLVHQPTEADHPGREAILASQNQDGPAVVRSWQEKEPATVVYKQMTHHLVTLPEATQTELLDAENTAHVLLIRNPEAILNSFSKVVKNVTAEDVGIPQQYQLFQDLQQRGRLAAVVDAQLLLEDPAGVLERLCERLQLPYTDKMLSWEVGARPEDGIWAEHWYANVHKSSGFAPFQPRTYDLPEHLAAIADELRAPYQEMRAVAL